MASQTILYDLPSKQGTAWSLNPWKTRMVLNYKGIDYKTEWVEYPDVEPRLKAFGLPPNAKDAPGYSVDYTIPAIQYDDGSYEMDSWPIAHELEKRYPSPSLHLDDPVTVKIRDHIKFVLGPIFMQIVPVVPTLLPERSQEYFNRTREAKFGMPVVEAGKVAMATAEEDWKRVEEPLRETADLLKKHGGPFFLGESASYADFIFVSALHFIRRLSEEAFQRIVSSDPALSRVYEACGQWLAKED